MRLTTTALRAIPVALLAIVIIAGLATASTFTVRQEFAVQGKAAGLTTAQITTLQRKANHYLATMGGRQVGLNKIDLNGKGALSIAIPGETHPRNLPGVQADKCNGWPNGAAYGYFCAYSGMWWTGDSIEMFYCNRYVVNFDTTGSWDNNQSTGARARMYNYLEKLVYTTPPAASHDYEGDWRGISYVRNC